MRRFSLCAAFALLAIITAGFTPALAEGDAKAAEEPAAQATGAAKATSDEALMVKDFNDDKFLDAAYDNCATVENRSANSCNCERKLIGDRVNLDDKQMAYLYWTDKKTFVTEFEKKKKADPDFPKNFSNRFSNLQALVIAACGA
ncbi:MAG: hypothetical protein AAFV45_00705 [Pseudomonadota bacterium]